MGILLIILHGAMLFFGVLISFLTRKWKPGGGYRALFFVLGTTIPIIDVPYTYVMLDHYCEGYTGIDIYEEFEPEGHFFIREKGYAPYHFALEADYIEWLDTSNNELWKLWLTDEGYTRNKKAIQDITSRFEYVKGSKHRHQSIVPGIYRGVAGQIVERSTSKLYAENFYYYSPNKFGWFFSTYWDASVGCSNRTKDRNERDRAFKRLLLGQDRLILQGGKYK